MHVPNKPSFNFTDQLNYSYLGCITLVYMFCFMLQVVEEGKNELDSLRKPGSGRRVLFPFVSWSIN